MFFVVIMWMSFFSWGLANAVSSCHFMLMYSDLSFMSRQVSLCLRKQQNHWEGRSWQDWGLMSWQKNGNCCKFQFCLKVLLPWSLFMASIFMASTISEGLNTHGWYLAAWTLHEGCVFAMQGSREFCGSSCSVCVSILEDAHSHRTAHVQIYWRAPLTYQHRSAASDGN